MVGYQIAAYTGPDAKEVILAWVKEKNYTPNDVVIKKSGDTVWVEKK